MASPTFQQVTPHIHRLELPFGFGPLRFPVAVWLVRDARGWVVIDAGAPGFEQTVIDQVLAATNGQQPYVLVLTHGHFDHAAAARRMRAEWRVPIAAGRDEVPYLTGAAHYAKLPARSPLYRVVQISPPALVGRNVHLPLDDGSVVGHLHAVHVPGHAPGMLALLHAEDRALVCADTFFHLRARLTDPPAAFTYDPALNRRSQQRLAELDFDHLLPSHGPVIMNTGREAVRALLASKPASRGRLATLLYGPGE